MKIKLSRIIIFLIICLVYGHNEYYELQNDGTLEMVRATAQEIQDLTVPVVYWPDYYESATAIQIQFADPYGISELESDNVVGAWDAAAETWSNYLSSQGADPLFSIVEWGGCLLAVSENEDQFSSPSSAGATVAVIGPVVLDMAVGSGTNPVLVGVGLAIATSMAYWLVIGTPASSIVYASGQLESKDFIRMATIGWPIALVALSVIIVIYWVGVLGIDPNGMGF